MKTKNITGTGIVGNKVVVNVVDMVMLSMLADRIEAVVNNHKAIADYKALPFDKRINEDGSKMVCPEHIDASDSDLKDVATFIRKCAGSFSKSSAFDAESNEVFLLKLINNNNINQKQYNSEYCSTIIGKYSSL